MERLKIELCPKIEYAEDLNECNVASSTDSLLYFCLHCMIKIYI